MRTNLRSVLRTLAPAFFIIGLLVFSLDRVTAADRLIGLHSAQVMSQSMPWIAQETGIFSQVQFGISVGLHRHFAAGYGGDVGR